MNEEDIYVIIEKGKDICCKNQFYECLKMLLKYYFISGNYFSSSKSDNLLHLMSEISKSEMEYKTFMIYKNFAVDVYTKKLEPKFVGLSLVDLTYAIIYYVKKIYDEDHNVLKPYIEELNTTETIESYNYVKLSYTIEKEQLEKIRQIQEIISLLEESDKLEIKAKNMKEKALKMIYQLKNDEIKLLRYCNFSQPQKESTKLLKL